MLETGTPQANATARYAPQHIELPTGDNSEMQP